MKKVARVGVSDHAGWAILVTVVPDGKVLDRRRVELVDASLPSLPHHHDAQGLPEKKAVALIERVQRSAEKHANAALEALAASVSLPIGAIAIRACPPLPPTIMERINDYRAQCVADTVMFREAIAGAAKARGWSVSWYEARRVLAEADQRLLEKTGAELGSPWTKDHRTAMAAAINAR